MDVHMNEDLGSHLRLLDAKYEETQTLLSSLGDATTQLRESVPLLAVPTALPSPYPFSLPSHRLTIPLSVACAVHSWDKMN